MSDRQREAGNLIGTLYSATITTAITAVGQTPVAGIVAGVAISFEAIFTYGSGGASADAYIQSSLDGGVTWFDIVNFHFTTATASKLASVNMFPSTPLAVSTPTDGALASNTVINGIIGDRLRAKITTVGTYAGGTLFAVYFNAKG